MAYHKTTVEVDIEALDEAARNLGTRGVKATVNAALREINRRAALRQAAALIRAGEFSAPDEETWRRWRTPRL